MVSQSQWGISKQAFLPRMHQKAEDILCFHMQQCTVQSWSTQVTKHSDVLALQPLSHDITPPQLRETICKQCAVTEVNYVFLSHEQNTFCHVGHHSVWSKLNSAWSGPFCLSPQRLFMMDDREAVLIKMDDPSNAVEFQDATLAWEKARSPAAVSNPRNRKGGGMKRVLRREKLSLYISTEDSKGNKDGPNAQSLLTNMEQESPQSTISSSQSIRPPLHKTLHRIGLRVKRVTIQIQFIPNMKCMIGGCV